MFFKIPVKVSDERVVLRASVTTADTVANRAATSMDMVAGSATLSEMAIDVTVEDRLLFVLGAVPAEVLVKERLLGGIVRNYCVIVAGKPVT